MLEYLETQKKLTTNQWKIVTAAILGDMLDFFDYFLIGFVLAFVVGGWHLTYGQSALICCRQASVPFPAPFSGAGWPTGSAGGRHSSARR